MALINQYTTDDRRDSMTSTISLWDKMPEPIPIRMNSENDNDDDDDELRKETDLTENETEEEFERTDDEVNVQRPAIRRFGSSSNLSNIQTNNQLWNYDKYNQIKLILNKTDVEEGRKIIEQRLLNQRIKLVRSDDDDDENHQIDSWYFGLSFIRFKLEDKYSIDISRLIAIQSFPFWLRFKNEPEQRRRPIQSKSAYIKPIRYGNSGFYRLALRSGALVKTDLFCYSNEDSWSNQSRNRWSLFLDNDYDGGYIRWVTEDSKERKTRELLANNIDHAVIICLFPDGFQIYINQRCNTNEFHANQKSQSVIRNRNLREKTSSRPGPVRPSFTDNRLPKLVNYEKDKRIGGTSNGIYFSTVQYELRINLNRLNNEKARNTVQQTLKVLVEFFESHRIRVCYGTIQSRPGPTLNSFVSLELPTFIMKYSYKMLENIGYRFQIQMNDKFRNNLLELSREKYNPDELFYRVCVYLSHLFTHEPFLHLSNELNYAIEESKRKREDATFGLISSLTSERNTEVYVPSVTITPSMIKIKPFKLCRTNRVLRAKKEFGEPLEHFILVEIRDENGQRLQSEHFRDLRQYFLNYLKNGFLLMDQNRCYKYLHHSQSQLRATQFWFYYHQPGLNSSFEDAYKWMVVFTKEKNIAKYASRMALCFTTTIPTIDIDDNVIQSLPDIKTKDQKFIFTDGCGTMSEKLRNDIQEKLHRSPFSVVQFRFAGAKGVVSVDNRLRSGHHLCIRESMDKFISPHRCFEVCKVSSPRSLYLNQQAILLLSHRKIADAVFLILQQQNHFNLIRALLRNEDAKYLLSDRLPYWFLPAGANIDFVNEPFFRQILITGCLLSTEQLLRKTRIRVPRNKARNMFGIIDEYNVLEADQVFVQYTRLNDYENDDDDIENSKKPRILENCKVVITKNPCHHPGDVRTFTAVDHPSLRHLKDVVVFSQRGDHPAPHQISGSDLDGDEYAVIWHEDLVPINTPNETPHNFDSQVDARTLDRTITRDDIINTVLEITESDFLGRLCKLHLAYADRYGVNSDERPANAILSTIELAGAISEEVDSAKTGYHPLNDQKIKQQNHAFGKQRPDFMAQSKIKSYESKKILGQLYRASRRTLPAWNRLLRKHRHLRHLQVRTPQDEEDEQEFNNETDNGENFIQFDSSLVNLTRTNQDHELFEIASQLFFVYRQEILEILSLYGLSHESQLWCRSKSINKSNSELEDTAYTQLEQLVQRTRQAFFLRLVAFCEHNSDSCNIDTPFENLCEECQDRHHRVAVALYRQCYSGQNGFERAPILSLPWLFITALFKTRQRTLPSTPGLLSKTMAKAISYLIDQRLLQLQDFTLKFRSTNNRFVEATVDWTVYPFIEIVNYAIQNESFPSWPKVLSTFIRMTNSFQWETYFEEDDDQWLLHIDQGQQDDIYAARLLNIEWTPDDDERMHWYFTQLIEICFDLSRNVTQGENEYLQISEQIILILQQIAIDETISTKKTKKIQS